MSSELSEEFNNDLRSQLLEIVTANNIEALDEFLALADYEQSDAEDALWQAGYFGYVEVANKIKKVCPESSPYSYIDGQFMAAVDSGDLNEMSNLIKEGADQFQANHTALYTPFVEGNTEVLEYLINLGLDPTVAFTQEDFDDLKSVEGLLISSERLGQIGLARVTSPDGEDILFGTRAQYDHQLIPKPLFS